MINSVKESVLSNKRTSAVGIILMFLGLKDAVDPSVVHHVTDFLSRGDTTHQIMMVLLGIGFLLTKDGNGPTEQTLLQAEIEVLKARLNSLQAPPEVQNGSTV